MEESTGFIGTGYNGSTGRDKSNGNGSAHESISNLNRRAHAAVDKAADVATHTADWLTTSHKDLTQSTASYVQANPLRSIGMAFATGFILAKLIR
jgi:ElaB/YqjD/DUF883 family membrane-anchored ribosome-binding protein